MLVTHTHTYTHDYFLCINVCFIIVYKFVLFVALFWMLLLSAPFHILYSFIDSPTLFHVPIFYLFLNKHHIKNIYTYKLKFGIIWMRMDQVIRLQNDISFFETDCTSQMISTDKQYIKRDKFGKSFTCPLWWAKPWRPYISLPRHDKGYSTNKDKRSILTV